MHRLTCLDVAKAAGLRPGRQSGAEQPFHCLGPGHVDGDQHASLFVNVHKDVWFCGPCNVSGNAWQLAAFLSGSGRQIAIRAGVRQWLAEHGLGIHNIDGKTVVATYSYVDESGTHLFDVVRFEPKDFRQRKADGTWSMKGVVRVLYRLPEVLKADTVYIVEGEKDVDNLHSIGLTATCNPGGAGKWRSDYSECFKANQRVVIIPDSDVPGRKHAEKVAQSLSGRVASLKVLKLPDLPPKGDVSDWLNAGGTRERLAALVATTPEYAGETERERTSRPVLVCLDEVQPEEVRWIWPGRFAKGKLSLVVGDPGNGKSTALIDVACRVTRGAEWPDKGSAESGSVLILTAEDGLADTVRPRVDVHGGDSTRFHALQGVHTGGDERPFSLETDIAHLEAAVDHIEDVRIIIIDPLSAYLGGRDSYKDSQVRAILTPLAKLAERCGVAIVGDRPPDEGDGSQGVISRTGICRICRGGPDRVWDWARPRERDAPDSRLRQKQPCAASAGVGVLYCGRRWSWPSGMGEGTHKRRRCRFRPVGSAKCERTRGAPRCRSVSKGTPGRRSTPDYRCLQGRPSKWVLRSHTEESEKPPRHSGSPCRTTRQAEQVVLVFAKGDHELSEGDQIR